jgi:glucose-6-phosphate 1-epimerase
MKTLPEGARLEKGKGGLERLVLETGESEAHVYMHGAHVAHFQPKGARPVLWVSRESAFVSGSAGKPIRGGIPICFPWFGPKAGQSEAPAHGFARLLPWSLDGVEPDPDGGLRATLALASDESTLRFFPDDFAARLVVSVSRVLRLELGVRNTGTAPFSFEEALHTYFAVGDVRRIGITGLEGAAYLDRTDAMARKTLGVSPLTIAGETDRVFGGHSGRVTIDDPAWGRRIDITRTGSRTAVVWNPWIEKARAMPDFGDDEWPEMACVESANALDDAVTLAPGVSHTLTTVIELVEPG